MLAPARRARDVRAPRAASTPIIGTTDTDTTARRTRCARRAPTCSTCSTAANAYFPDAGAHRATTSCSAWAGIRPLIASSADDHRRRSREHAITRHRAGVITVTGGKLTTYRSMAAQVVDRVQADARQAAHAARAPDTKELRDRDSRPASRARRRPLVPGLPHVWGQVRDAVTHGMALHVSDVLVRRTQLAFETRDHGVSVAPAVARVLAPLLGWSAGARARRGRALRRRRGADLPDRARSALRRVVDRLHLDDHQLARDLRQAQQHHVALSPVESRARSASSSSPAHPRTRRNRRRSGGRSRSRSSSRPPPRRASRAPRDRSGSG